MKGIRINEKHEFFEKLIDELLSYSYTEDADKLLMASLQEVVLKIKMKLITFQPKYKVQFSIPQSIALGILYTEFIDEYHTYLGNKLHQISNDVKQKFQ